MAQFDVYRNTNAATRGHTPYILDVQADVMSVLPTRLVCPVRLVSGLRIGPIERIHLTVTIEDEQCVVFLSELTAVPASIVGGRLGSFQRYRQDIIAGIDLLITGF
jgi:toxin CcdB